MTTANGGEGVAIAEKAVLPACRSNVRASKGSYGQIIKSSALIGGSTVINIGLGIVRTKAMALLLGPGGIGLLGLYGSIADLARTIAGMGIGSSGVRQIAESASLGDAHKLARTVRTLRTTVLALAVLGSLLLGVLCQPVARFTFGDDLHTGGVALLAVAVLLGAVSAGQTAVLQGFRRIADLAKANVLGSFLGLLAAVPIVYYLGKAGVVPSLVAVAGLGLVASWWYSRKIKVEPVALKGAEISAEAKSLLKLGFVFMSSVLMMMGVAYLVRIIVIRRMGEDAAGYYQSAWVLGGLYVGFILQAMGADFFPRLTTVAGDRKECNRLVNEQAEVGLLMAGPGVIGTLALAPLVIQVFYSSKFGPAIEVLRWICLGMALRVASWPMSFILLAKGARQPYFWSELVTNLVQVGLVWVCVIRFGLNGTGIAFFGGYVFYWFLIYAIVRSASGFRWSAANKQVGLLYGVVIAVVFAARYVLPPPWMLAVGTMLALGAGVHAAKRLSGLVPVERLPRVARQVAVWLRLVPGKDQA